MIKILLCIEDHMVLNKMSLVFKKLGFDVETLNTETGLHGKLLGFKADVVIASGMGHKVSPINISKKLNEWGNFKLGVKYIVLLNNQYKIPPAALASVRVDGFLEADATMVRTLDVVCQSVKSAKADFTSIVEKLHRMIHTGQLVLPDEKAEPTSLSNNSVASVTNSVTSVTELKLNKPKENISAISLPTAASDQERVHKYLKFTQNLPKTSVESISRADARRVAKEMSKDWDMEDLEFLDAEKRKFVRALFRKPG
jgi:hypothetical protein